MAMTSLTITRPPLADAPRRALPRTQSSRTALEPLTPPTPLIEWALETARQTPGFGTDVAATLGWCIDVGKRAPRVGAGRTRELWELMAAVAALDVSAARMLEPHLDALSILHQSGLQPDSPGLERLPARAGSTWGVFAAEASGRRLEALPDSAGWRLRGTKPWCSLAAHLTHALVTASVDGGGRRLFAVDLRDSRVRPHKGPWFARGLESVVSADVDFDDVPALAVGDAGWYLTRPGFAWGGMTVAACWWGAAVAIAEPLRAAARSERADQLAQVHLGRADAALWAARSVLAEAADLVDGGESPAIGDRLLAERVRGVVVDAATLALAESDAALGPAPLVSDEAHARRVADLHLYLRQHHGPRDFARIGRDLAGAEDER
jgi:alkylation response protein AidB-like acyl-CoA dehydrogenase